MKWQSAIMVAVILFGGCSSWDAEKVTEYFADPNETALVKRVTVRAKQSQCMTDSSRMGMKFKIDDLGKASVGTSILDAESVAAIVAELKPFFLTLMTGG